MVEDESPFTLAGHPVADMMSAGVRPPKRPLAGSPANYWLLDEAIITNMQWAVTPLDPSLPVFKSPHCVVAGTVAKVINEADGDHHLCVELDGGNFHLTCYI